MSRLKFVFRATLVGALVALSAAHFSSWARFNGPVNRLSIDLAVPDVAIASKSLSRVPRDLLTVPLLRDVLTEDFVFYYEHDEQRLGIAGSLRRIAYEHELKWNDHVLDWLFDGPAEMAMWRNANGAIEHGLIVLERGRLGRIMQDMVALALKDSQLKKAGELRIGDESVTVLSFEYGPRGTLLLVPHGNRLAILSDPGMLLSETGKVDPQAEKQLAALLGAPGAEPPAWRAALLGGAAAEHRLAVSARYLSAGYQHFFPGVEAVRFDYRDRQWSTAIRFQQEATLQTQSSAQVLPARPAACAWLPLVWPTEQTLGKKTPHLPAALPAFASTGAACWYAQSSLETPLFVAELKAEADAATDQALGAYFDWMVQGERGAKPIERPGVVAWQKSRASGYARASEDEGKEYRPTLARKGRVVLFSPDGSLVEQALDTLDHRYPSVADATGAGGGENNLATLAILTPASLAKLVRQASQIAVPRAEQPVLHDALGTHLPARLAALEKYPAYRVVLAQAGQGWRPVQWQVLAGQP